MITVRDTEVIDFLNKYKIARPITLQQVFYPSKRVSQRRLKTLIDEKYLKRIRDSIRGEYIYYYKKLPEQIKHSLLITDFYRELYKRYGKVSFKTEPIYGDIRPDAVFGYEIDGRSRLGLLEVEISNKGFNWEKYNSFFNEEYKKHLPVLPVLCIISDKVKFSDCNKLNHRGVNTIIIKTDMNNFKLP